MQTSTTASDPADPKSENTTAPANYPVMLVGFGNPEEGERLARTVSAIISIVGESVDVSRLDGVTIAFDYDEALRQLDRGYEASRPLTRSREDHIVGVAMSPNVIRDGQIKAHLVFYAPVLLPLLDRASPGFHDAIYIVAHECGHLGDLLDRDTAMPNVILQHRFASWEEAFLTDPAEAIWCEYAACRYSSSFGGMAAIERYREALRASLGTASTRADAAIIDFRIHGDINRLLAEAGTALVEPVRLAAYLAGSLDGLGMDAMTKMQVDFGDDQAFPEVARATVDTLRTMWETRGTWSSLSVYEPLRDVIRGVLAGGGILLQRQEDGTTCVAVPYGPRTMPPCDRTDTV